MSYVKAENQAITNSSSAEGTVEVLYQKMGDRWFAFSLIGEEVFVGSLTQEEIARAEDDAKILPTDQLERKVHSRAGNS